MANAHLLIRLLQDIVWKPCLSWKVFFSLFLKTFFLNNGILHFQNLLLIDHNGVRFKASYFYNQFKNFFFAIFYLLVTVAVAELEPWGCIFSHVRPFYEWVVSDLDP